MTDAPSPFYNSPIKSEGESYVIDGGPPEWLRESIRRAQEIKAENVFAFGNCPGELLTKPLPRLTRFRHWLGEHIVSLAEWVSGKAYAEW